jgi:16S rRNA (cytidine1402-2'-O)-methyltransferase
MSEAIEAGVLYVVSTPIGNLDDITRRAVHILGGVALVAAEDTRTTRVLLSHLGLSTPLISYHSHNETRRIPELVARLRRGDALAMVTDAGTPGISDPAFRVIRAAIEAGIRVIPVPGASAVLAAVVASGLPMDRFIFEGFLPLKKGRQRHLRELAAEPRTIVLYEAPHRIIATLEDLRRVMGERQVALCRELTKKFEEVVRGTLGEVLAHLERSRPRGEMVIVLQGTGRGKRHAEGTKESTSSEPDL